MLPFAASVPEGREIVFIAGSFEVGARIDQVQQEFLVSSTSGENQGSLP